MRRSIEQNRRLYYHLHLMSYDDEKKRELIARCTGQRTIHSHEMDHVEIEFAINELKAKRQQIIRKYMPVIGVCAQALGWTVPDHEHGGTSINWVSLNAYVEKWYHCKGFMTLPAADMPKLITGLKSIAKAKGVKL